MATTAAIPSIMGTMTDDPLSLLAKEWLITNGIGGYASNTLLGIATRRYHGLFVPDLPGRGRILIIPRLDETVEVGGQSALLAGAEYADGRIEHEPRSLHRTKAQSRAHFGVAGSNFWSGGLRPAERHAWRTPVQFRPKSAEITRRECVRSVR